MTRERSACGVVVAGVCCLAHNSQREEERPNEAATTTPWSLLTVAGLCIVAPIMQCHHVTPRQLRQLLRLQLKLHRVARARAVGESTTICAPLGTTRRKTCSPPSGTSTRTTTLPSASLPLPPPPPPPPPYPIPLPAAFAIAEPAQRRQRVVRPVVIDAVALLVRRLDLVACRRQRVALLAPRSRVATVCPAAHPGRRRASQRQPANLRASTPPSVG